ncbi:MAG: 4-hydroxythreonine-4-phosphate dehydrogenase PdxA [Saprospiraceae bacterium]|nr:4-hydroxythreonine-4-phosphate dehydrogenase PdxA [Saprospiraceae bacterium]MBK8482818.1 4-hydroxythreonine-4-phosphate dehydrogenase PdxA [Saprospiraceae bacterium]MBK9722823.1 4-hydroxythreonine-4-phosphate dehydrogenase PdxA [Saprospiraceae bacterium]MBK9726724.1 4-hydroxythreonine-4-phosphate dehydrogenase PdxA [Saprospiraceae bacterium]
MEKVKIGITCGDINSISLEVILKALNNDTVFKSIIPIIYGNVKIASYHKNIAQLENLSFNMLGQGERPRAGRINLVNCWNDNVTITLGKPSPDGGKYAQLALDRAIQDIQKAEIDALVTGPVHKMSMRMAGFQHSGHTGYLLEKSTSKDCLMFMISDKIRVGLVTEHIPIAQVTSAITKESVLSKLRIMEQALMVDFGIEKPHIAVLGLNPHAGDEGLIGSEDEEIIRPAIIEAKKAGLFVAGPYSSDGFFGSGQFNKFDGILAMYHDQGLIPFKTISQYQGVNYTAGLNFVRTSPDHGTAFELAGKNEADPTSMSHALFMAKDIILQRNGYHEMHQNVLKKRPKLSEELSE